MKLFILVLFLLVNFDAFGARRKYLSIMDCEKILKEFTPINKMDGSGLKPPRPETYLFNKLKVNYQKIYEQALSNPSLRQRAIEYIETSLLTLEQSLDLLRGEKRDLDNFPMSGMLVHAMGWSVVSEHDAMVSYNKKVIKVTIDTIDYLKELLEDLNN